MATKFLTKVYRMFKKLGVVGYSRKRNIFGMHPLLVSTIFIILTLTIASLARKLVKSVLCESTVRSLILEFIATAELCACCFELIIVADNFGIWAYALYLFLLTVWWSTKWEDASACPYVSLEEVLEGSQNVLTAVLIIISQLLGGLVIYGYVQTLWGLELSEMHRGRAYEECMADLQVPMIIGAVVECVATFLCRLTSKIIADIEPRFANIYDAFFATMMVVAAFNFSGGYFNPALATSLKYGCEGNTFVEHMVVYWIGASAGALLSVLAFDTRTVQCFIKEIQGKVY